MEQINNALEKICTKLEKQHNSNEKEWGTSTGYTDIDYITEGLHKGDLILIASTISMGNTELALNILTNVAKLNIPVAIFSLEMTKEQYISKMLCVETEVSECKLKFADFNNDEWLKIELLEKQIYIDDTLLITINEVREKATKLKQEKDIGLILIDSFELIQESFNRNEKQIAELSNTLKQLAEELNVPIIVTSKLSNKLQDHRPTLKDLKETRSLGQVADVIMFVHREDFYTEGKKNNIAEVIVTKNKYGRCTTIELLAKDECSKFIEVKKEINQKIWEEKD